MSVKIMKNIDIYARPIKQILTISSFRGLKRPQSCEIGLMIPNEIIHLRYRWPLTTRSLKSCWVKTPKIGDCRSFVNAGVIQMKLL